MAQYKFGKMTEEQAIEVNYGETYHKECGENIKN